MFTHKFITFVLTHYEAVSTKQYKTLTSEDFPTRISLNTSTYYITNIYVIADRNKQRTAWNGLTIYFFYFH